MELTAPQGELPEDRGRGGHQVGRARVPDRGHGASLESAGCAMELGGLGAPAPALPLLLLLGVGLLPGEFRDAWRVPWRKVRGSPHPGESGGEAPGCGPKPRGRGHGAQAVLRRVPARRGLTRGLVGRGSSTGQPLPIP